MKVINTVLEIDPKDPTVIELNRLASKFGLTDMAAVLREVAGLFEMQHQQVAFRIDLTTYRTVAKVFISAAIVNYAVSVHPEFYVNLPEQPEQMPRLYLTATADKHREHADKYLTQVKQLVSQFEN